MDLETRYGKELFKLFEDKNDILSLETFELRIKLLIALQETENSMNEEQLKFICAITGHDKDTIIQMFNDWLKSPDNKASQLDPLVRGQIAELKQNITKHFDSEIMLLENSAEDTINCEEYKIRKKEIRRQKFYMRLILRNLSA
jgi:hypothetical protein